MGKEEVGVYVINYVNVNNKKLSVCLNIIIFILYLILICIVAIAMLLFWAILMCDEFSISNIKSCFDASVINGGAIFSGTLTATTSILLAFLNKKYLISQKIINWLIAKKFKKREKQLAPNNIDDITFLVANDIVNILSRKKDNAYYDFHTININQNIDNFNLIYAIYRQLYYINHKESESKQTPTVPDINDVALYNFALQSGSCMKNRILESYQLGQQVKNIIVLVNGNYLSEEDKFRFYRNLNSPMTLAYGIFDLRIDRVNQIQPILQEYKIDINNIARYDQNKQCLIILLILESILGYIPIKDIWKIISKSSKLCLRNYMNKNFLWGKTFLVNKYYKAKKLNITKLSQQFASGFSESHYEVSNNDYLDKLLEYLYENKLYYAYLELSALLNIYNEKTISAINVLIKKHCTTVSLARIQLYTDNEINENFNFIVQKAIITEKCGDIKGTNELLVKLNKITPWVLDLNGNIRLKNDVPCDDIILNIIKENMQEDIANDYFAVLFENIHGIDKNRNTLLQIIKLLKKIKINSYWETHINLECGKPDDDKVYSSLIQEQCENFEKNVWSYEFLNGMRRLYADYANATYTKAYINDYYDNNKCKKMLATVNDTKLKGALGTYDVHFRRMAVGDLIMNYCLPVLAKSDMIDLSITLFLNNCGFNKKSNNLDDLTEFALQTYNRCLKEFCELNDKSYKTTKTRIINAEMTLDITNLDINQKVNEIEEFYKNSSFEVFVSYGLALKLKLYILKTFSLDIIFESNLLNSSEDYPNDTSVQNKFTNQYKEILKYTDKILKVFECEINEYSREINFSRFSNDRFIKLFGFIEAILSKINKDTQEDGILSYFDKDETITKEAKTVLKRAKAVSDCFSNKNGIKNNLESTSMISRINNLRYMPVILL